MLYCSKCDNPATLMCQRCHDPYCTIQCQVSDWRIHKTKCMPMPRLVPLNEPTPPARVEHSLGKFEVKTKTLPNIWQMNVKPHELDYFEAVVRYVEKTVNHKVYWLCPTEHADKLQKMVIHMRNLIPLTLANLQVGNLVIALHMQAFRAKVLKVDVKNAVVVVQRIDIGDKLDLSINSLYAANEDMYLEPAFVFPAIIKNVQHEIELTEVISLSMETSELTPEGYYRLLEKRESSAVVSIVEASSIIKVKVMKIHGLNSIYFSLDQPEFADEYENLQAELQTSKIQATNGNMEPAQLIAALLNEVWYRALLLRPNIVDNLHLVYFIDEGSVRFCKQIGVLPAIYAKQEPRMIIVKIKETSGGEAPNLNANGTLTIDNLLECNLKIGNLEYSGQQIKIVELFANGEYGYWCEGIEHGSSVYISFVKSVNEVWAYAGNLIMLRRILEKYAAKCKPLEKIAKDYLSCTVLAQVSSNSDEKFFIRGIVMSTEEDIAEICDIDTSVVYYVDQADVCRAVPLICALPAQVTLVTLDMPANIGTMGKKHASLMLKKFVDNQVTLELQRKAENPATANLIYHNENGIARNLSAVIFDKENPAKKKIEPEARVENVKVIEKQVDKTLLVDIPLVPIPEGNSLTLLVIDSSEIAEKNIMAALVDGTNIVKTMQQQAFHISKYCEKALISSVGYSPVLYEFCLAKFKEDNEWYRARCLEVLKNGNFKLVFIDYGNMIEAEMKDIIGPLPKELQTPIYANLCKIKDVANLQELEDKILANPIIKCKVTKDKNNTYLTPI